MTTRQLAYRLKSEGKAELLRDQREVAEGFQKTYAAAEAGANAASAATERQERRLRAMAEAARASQQASAGQTMWNMYAGVNSPSERARDSASVFIANDNDAARADMIRASIDPLWAAQNRYNQALEETNRLRRSGHLTAEEAARRENLLQKELDETTAALNRNTSGLTRRQLAGRLNLMRQAPDVAVTLAGGMSPAMVALQQGPQILDAMAESGIRLTPVMIGVGAAVAAVAGGTALLTAAYIAGEASAASYEKAVTGVGRTAGLSASELRTLVGVNADLGDISISSAKKQADAYLATGRIGGEVIGGLIRISKDYASFMGFDAADASKLLAKAMQDPYKAGEEMTRTFGLLTQAELDQIEASMKAGDQMRAQQVLLEALDKAVAGHADQVGEITNAWDAVTTSISDAITKFNEWVYVTDAEKLAGLDEKISDLMQGRVTPGTIRAAMSPGGQDAELARLQAQRSYYLNAESARVSEQYQRERQGSANQADQLAEDRRKAAEAEARRAQAQADREAREREREAREALRRTRREEDRGSTLDIEVARLGGQTDRVQQLQDDVALRNRIRELIDDGVSATEAETRALAEQTRLLEARAEAAQVEAEARAEGLAIQDAVARGDHASAQEMQDRVDRQEVFNAYLDIWKNKSLAILTTDIELAAVAKSRADAVERAARAARDEHQLNLARLSGDSNETRRLSLLARMEARAREIEAREKLNRGAGDARAAVEISQEVAAEAEGVRREWTKSFIADIRQGGIREALASQFESAADRMIDRLVDGLFEIDWAALMNTGNNGSGGSSGGGWLDWIGTAFNALVGKNAEGTDYWRGGLTWVGERGPELINAPRGSQIYDHGRSMKMAAAGGGGQVNHYYLSGNLLTPEFWAEIQKGDQQAAALGASQGSQRAVGFIKASDASARHTEHMMKK